MIDYMSKSVTVFKDMTTPTPLTTIRYFDYFEMIRDGEWRRDVELYNSGLTAKKHLPCITPSGTFKNRKDNGLVGEHTGIIVLDLDFKDNQDIDIEESMEYIAQEPSVLAIHKSVSGKGLAIYVTLADNLSYKDYNHVRTTFEDWYDIKLDKSTSNISRLRIVSYDPDIIVNEQPLPFDIPVPIKKEEKLNCEYTDSSDESYDKVLIDVMAIMRGGIEPTSTYFNWIKLGFIIANLYGEQGRQMFHVVSANHSEYNYGKTDKQYDNLMKHKNGSGSVTKASIFYMLKQ